MTDFVFSEIKWKPWYFATLQLIKSDRIFKQFSKELLDCYDIDKNTFVEANKLAIRMRTMRYTILDDGTDKYTVFDSEFYNKCSKILDVVLYDSENQLHNDNVLKELLTKKFHKLLTEFSKTLNQSTIDTIKLTEIDPLKNLITCAILLLDILLPKLSYNMQKELIICSSNTISDYLEKISNAKIIKSPWYTSTQIIKSSWYTLTQIIGDMIILSGSLLTIGYCVYRLI